MWLIVIPFYKMGTLTGRVKVKEVFVDCHLYLEVGAA